MLFLQHSRFQIINQVNQSALLRACVQQCPTLCNHIDYSSPGSSVHGIAQAKILEWVAMFTSRVSSWSKDQTHNSCVSCLVGRFFTAESRGTLISSTYMLSLSSCVALFVTLWTVAHQAPLSMGFSRQEYWSGCLAILQGIFPPQGLNLCLLCLLHWQACSLPLASPGKGSPNL